MQGQANQLTGLEYMLAMLEGRVSIPPLPETGNVKLIVVEAGRVILEGKLLGQPHSQMVDWTSLLLDRAMGSSVLTTLGAGVIYATIDFRTTFVRQLGAAISSIRCEATVRQLGGGVASSEGRVFDTAGNLLAHGSKTCLIIPSSSGEGPEVEESSKFETRGRLSRSASLLKKMLEHMSE